MASLLPPRAFPQLLTEGGRYLPILYHPRDADESMLGGPLNNQQREQIVIRHKADFGPSNATLIATRAFFGKDASEKVRWLGGW